MIEYKEKIQGDKEVSDQILKEKIRKLQQERERGAGRGFSRPKIKELDEEIERLMRKLGI